jgi:Atypical PilZ domain, cyclic di-GMP receptor
LPTSPDADLDKNVTGQNSMSIDKPVDISATPQSPSTMSLVYETSLPLRWHKCDTSASIVRGYRQDENKKFLKAITCLEDSAVDATNAEDRSEHSSDVVRLEAKLDLLVGLISQIIKLQSDVPVSLLLKLSADGMEWEIPDNPTVPEIPAAPVPHQSQEIDVELYLRPDLPLPLFIPAKVTAVEHNLNFYRVCVLFEEMPLPVQELLERTIFRRHRQSIARVRDESK